MPVRVLWVVKGLGPGGAETLLAAAARAHDHATFDIECAYVLPWKDHLAAKLERAGVRTTCLSTRRRDPLWALRLWRVVRTGGWDVVHIHSPLPGVVARCAVRSLAAAKRPQVVTTEHNRWDTYRTPTRLLNRWTSRWDSDDLAVSDEVMASMRGRVVDRTTSVRHGIDVAATRAALDRRAAMRASFGFDDDDVVVGTVANFRPQKDHPNLLAAFRLLVDRQVSFRGVIVGQGPLEAEIRARATELGLDESVVLTGFRADAVDVMAAFDVFVLASQWEGLPVAVMEALALGLPIVATDVGGVAEALSDGRGALLVPPGRATALADALGSVVADPLLRMRLGKAAADRAPEFDVGRTVATIEAIYSAHSTAKTPATSSPRPPAGPTRTPSGTDIRHATPDDRPAVLELLGRSLGTPDDPRYPQLFAWKHDQNPFGASPMWVATVAGRVVAFRTFMRWEFERGDDVLRAVRAVDTATAPEHQGRGLFTALTTAGLEQLRSEGVDLVFNTPNESSRPGYLKMGWRDVGRLPAAVRFARPSSALRAMRSRVPAERWSNELTIGEPFHDWLARDVPLPEVRPPIDVREIRTRASAEFLSWRYGSPLLGYRVVEDEGTTVIVRERTRGAASELAVVATFGDPAAADRLAGRTLTAGRADYAIRLGPSRPVAGFVPLPRGGPMLTWRGLGDAGPPPLSNWALTLGDIELF